MLQDATLFELGALFAVNSGRLLRVVLHLGILTRLTGPALRERH